MGLLDFLPQDEDKKSAALQGLLAAGLGMMANSYNQGGRLAPALGAGGMQGMQAYGSAIESANKQKQQALAVELQKMQLAQAKQGIADAEALRNFDASKYYLTPQQQAIAKFGPTPEGAAAITQFQPKFDQKGMISGMMSSGSPALRQQAMGMLTKDNEPIKLSKDDKLLERGTWREIASNVHPEIKNGYIVPDGKGGWKVDPVLFAAEEKLKQTGATKVSVSPTVKVGETFDKGVADAAASRLIAQVGTAESAVGKAQAAGEILTALDSGKVMAGPGTTWKVAANQMFGSNPEKLAETRKVISGFAKISLESRQSLKGTGPITEGEQAMLTKAASGDIDKLSVGEIRLIAESAMRNAQADHARGKKANAALAGKPEFKSIMPAFEIPDMPVYTPSTPPEGAVRRIR